MPAISSKVCPAAVKAFVNVSSPKTKAKIKATPQEFESRVQSWERSPAVSNSDTVPTTWTFCGRREEFSRESNQN